MKHTVILLLMALVGLPITGYGVMHMLTFVLPHEGGGFGNIIFTIALLTLGLLIPFWMLKIGFHAAHLQNPEEKEFSLKDIPKDKNQLAGKI